jgi:alpha-tubulin suppressor-like RCC1 family protein
MKARSLLTAEDSPRDVTCSAWGLNDCKQLLECESQIVPRPTAATTKKGIFGLASGDFHTLLVTESRKLCAAGLNIYGQRGTPTLTREAKSAQYFQEVPVS